MAVGLVYKIFNVEHNILYIGSTIKNLKDRWYCHKSAYVSNRNNISIQYYFDKYGIENFKIETIKEYEICDIKQLKVYETLIILKHKNCINKNLAFNPLCRSKQYKKQYGEINKEKISLRSKEYKEINKEKINIQNSKYYFNNKNNILLKNKEYREINKEKITEQSKQYREINKDKIKKNKSEKFNCECGGSWTKGNGFPRHEKTKKHQKFLIN